LSFACALPGGVLELESLEPTEELPGAPELLLLSLLPEMPEPLELWLAPLDEPIELLPELDP
jgi:hypothetical protein